MMIKTILATAIACSSITLSGCSPALEGAKIAVDLALEIVEEATSNEIQRND